MDFHLEEAAAYYHSQEHPQGSNTTAQLPGTQEELCAGPCKGTARDPVLRVWKEEGERATSFAQSNNQVLKKTNEERSFATSVQSSLALRA